MEVAVFDFRMRGGDEGDITPVTLPIRELVGILAAVEEAVVSVALAQDPSLKREEIVVGLKAIEEGSVRLQFVTAIRQAVLSFSILAMAVHSDTFDLLPRQARDSVRTLSNFAVKRGVDMEFYNDNIQHAPLATLRHTDPPKLDTRLIDGYTSLYGELLSIGGAEPAFRLRLLDGDIFPCECSRKFAKDLAASNLLYEIIGVRGKGRFNPLTLELVDFKAEELLAYEHAGPGSAFAELRDAVGGSFDNTDAEAFVREVRGV